MCFLSLVLDPLLTLPFLSFLTSPLLPLAFSHCSIGYFDLDPNRVLDLILDTMEHQIWNLSFLVLLKQFRKSSIAHILGFKFTQFKTTSQIEPSIDEAPSSSASSSTPSSSLSPSSHPTPASLYALTALLLSAELISLDQILSYFNPTFHDLKAIVADNATKLREEINAYGVVNLTKKSETKSMTPSGVAAAAVDSPSSYAEGYQLIGLLAAALTIRNWKLAQELLQLLKVQTSLSTYPSFPTSLSSPLCLSISISLLSILC
jgi:THO complex subunit 2